MASRPFSAGRYLLTELSQVTNLSSASELDVSSTRADFGLEVYGSGTSTGIVADSGSTEVSACFCMRHDTGKTLQTSGSQIMPFTTM